jgi:hypothetical protein
MLAVLELLSSLDIVEGDAFGTGNLSKPMSKMDSRFPRRPRPPYGEELREAAALAGLEPYEMDSSYATPGMVGGGRRSVLSLAGAGGSWGGEYWFLVVEREMGCSHPSSMKG